ncbi:MAG: 2-oxoglutarate/2-oxoacid ferredoxin oxidoreductase subunit alpha [Candidatus Cloacimonadota bacterium]|nr:2-oxoglutarate/2-oxoacid ferredoxin oxidoreductase subunit alpha [Candidatus Cloacimonadota bacterium]
MTEKILTVLIGGKAGEGVKKAAQVIADMAAKLGNYTFQVDDYQSLIKGGHNFSVVSISAGKLCNAYKKADLIISFDQRSVLRHQEDGSEDALHFCNEGDAQGSSAIPLPLAKLKQQSYPDGGTMSIAAIAIFAAVGNINYDFMLQSIAEGYHGNSAGNTAFAEAVYKLFSPQEMQVNYHISKHRMVPQSTFSGNQLIALGAWAAGMDCYYGYPMTPASPLLHYLAKQSDKLKVLAMQVESELAAINMAIGSVFAGKRSMVGSSGGGFALMQEGFALAGMVEAPLLCVLSSRPGPATGVSTYTAQEDLYFALNQGHGEFPRIVASPDCFERAFSLAAELLDLVWECQSPAILLTEKHLSESRSNIDLPIDDIPEATQTIPTGQKPYQRYEITESGISPLKFPGTQNCAEDDVIKWNSNEHLESGVRTDEAPAIVAMRDKRKRKYETIAKATSRYQRVAIYGSGQSVVFAYGSTAMELREAQKYHAFTLVVPIYLEPFPGEELASYAGQEVIVAEHSSQAHFAEFLKNKLKVKVKATILRYDGRHFGTDELVQAIKEAENA